MLVPQCRHQILLLILQVLLLVLEDVHKLIFLDGELGDGFIFLADES